MDTLKFPLEAGGNWKGNEADTAGRHPEVLAFCLRQSEIRSLESAMHSAMPAQSAECVQLLYGFG